MAQVQQSGSYKNLTSSGAFSLTPGSLIGFYVNSTTGGTIVIKDGGTSGTAVSGTITPAVGWHTYPAQITSSSGGFATLANTIDVTFIFSSNS